MWKINPFFEGTGDLKEDEVYKHFSNMYDDSLDVFDRIAPDKDCSMPTITVDQVLEAIEHM